ESDQLPGLCLRTASGAYATTSLVLNTASQVRSLANTAFSEREGNSSLRNGNEEGGEVLLCRSHKIQEQDMRRMADKVRQTEQLLAEAERNKNQAIENYKEIFAKTLDHADVEIRPGMGVTIHNPGSLCTYDVPDLFRLKTEEQNACSEYNFRLLQYAQEKSLYGNMQRTYFEQHNERGFWGVAWDGAKWAFWGVIEIFNKNF
ncbi:MAG TPA: hypothetical protein VJK48_01535, partial [Chlamydiales bacterium]|nr:hypothetical protein [Chlamydiales bacterium]